MDRPGFAGMKEEGALSRAQEHALSMLAWRPQLEVRLTNDMRKLQDIERRRLITWCLWTLFTGPTKFLTERDFFTTTAAHETCFNMKKLLCFEGVPLDTSTRTRGITFDAGDGVPHPVSTNVDHTLQNKRGASSSSGGDAETRTGHQLKSRCPKDIRQNTAEQARCRAASLKMQTVDTDFTATCTPAIRMFADFQVGGPSRCSNHLGIYVHTRSIVRDLRKSSVRIQFQTSVQGRAEHPRHWSIKYEGWTTAVS